MKKLIFLYLLLLPMSVLSQEKEKNQSLIVWQTDGNQTKFNLEDEPNISFEFDNMIISTGRIETRYPIDYILRLTYDLGNIDSVGQITVDGFIEVWQRGNIVRIRGLKINTILTLYNIEGEKVFSQKSDGNGIVEFDLNNYISGIYILNFNGQTYKFMKR